jgi:transcriptional regulator with XRE-family HTH domain
MKFHYDVPMKKERTALHVLRAKQRVSQDRLIQRIALHLPKGRTMSQARYSQIENGIGRESDTDEQTAVAAALGVKVADIAWPDFPKAKAS